MVDFSASYLFSTWICFLARRLPKWLERLAFQILPYFTYILLIAIAIEFSTTLHSIAEPWQILNHAALLAVMTSIGAFVCCYILFKLLGYQPSHGKVSMSLVSKSLINISYAFIALALGYGLAELSSSFGYTLHISTWNLLLVFMFLIGLDLAYSPLDRSWLNWQILLVPLGCILGSIIGAVCNGLFCAEHSTKRPDYVVSRLWFLLHDWHCGHGVKECTFRQYCTDE